MVEDMPKINITKKDIILIGNGPSAIKHKLGSLIDSFHNIGRFNNFHIHKFEKFVGTKTTHWFTVDHFGEIKNRENFQQIYYVSLPTWQISERFNKFRNRYENPRYDGPAKEKIFKIIIPFPEIAFWEIIREYGNNVPSTGLATILLSSMIYERVYISGFDFFSSNKHHYGDNSDDCHHNAEKEKETFDKIYSCRKNIFYLRDFQ